MLPKHRIKLWRKTLRYSALRTKTINFKDNKNKDRYPIRQSLSIARPTLVAYKLKSGDRLTIKGEIVGQKRCTS